MKHPFFKKIGIEGTPFFQKLIFDFSKKGVRVFNKIDKTRCFSFNPLKTRNNHLHFRIRTARSGVRIWKWRFATIN